MFEKVKQIVEKIVEKIKKNIYEDEVETDDEEATIYFYSNNK